MSAMVMHINNETMIIRHVDGRAIRLRAPLPCSLAFLCSASSPRLLGRSVSRQFSASVDWRRSSGHSVADTFVEGSAAREHLEKDAAKPPDVRAFVHYFAARLLRAHVSAG